MLRGWDELNVLDALTEAEGALTPERVTLCLDMTLERNEIDPALDGNDMQQIPGEKRHLDECRRSLWQQHAKVSPRLE